MVSVSSYTPMIRQSLRYHDAWLGSCRLELATVPAHIFEDKSFFVVEAVRFSIPRFRWMDWSAPYHFFMKIWSFSEVWHFKRMWI